MKIYLSYMFIVLCMDMYAFPSFRTPKTADSRALRGAFRPLLPVFRKNISFPFRSYTDGCKKSSSKSEKKFLQFGKWLYLCTRFRRKNGVPLGVPRRGRENVEKAEIGR